MARTASGIPFRLKDRTGKEVGSYRVYDPAQGKTVSLNTRDESEAQRLAGELLAGSGGNVVRQAAYHSNGNGQPNLADGQAPTSGMGGHASAQSTQTPQHGIGGQAVLNWATGGMGNTGQLGVSGVGNAAGPAGAAGAANPATFATLPGGISGMHNPIVPGQRAVLPTPPRKTGALTPEQAQRLGRGMKSIVCKVNVIAAEGVVKFLGRDPFPLEDEDLQLLALGWELYLEQYFGTKSPPPWLLIVAGNVMVIFAMWMRGTPRPKPERKKVPDPPKPMGAAAGPSEDVKLDWGK